MMPQALDPVAIEQSTEDDIDQWLATPPRQLSPKPSSLSLSPDVKKSPTKSPSLPPASHTSAANVKRSSLDFDFDDTPTFKLENGAPKIPSAKLDQAAAEAMRVLDSLESPLQADDEAFSGKVTQRKDSWESIVSSEDEDGKHTRAHSADDGGSTGDVSEGSKKSQDGRRPSKIFAFFRRPTSNATVSDTKPTTLSSSSTSLSGDSDSTKDQPSTEPTTRAGPKQILTMIGSQIRRASIRSLYTAATAATASGSQQGISGSELSKEKEKENVLETEQIMTAESWQKLVDENDDLIAQNAKLRSQIQDAKLNSDMHQQVRQGLNDQIHALEKDLQKSQQDMAALNNIITSMQAESVQLEKKFLAEEVKKVLAEESTKARERQLERLADMMNQINDQLEKVQAERDSATTQLQSILKQHDEREALLESTLTEKESLLAKMAEFESKLLAYVGNKNEMLLETIVSDLKAWTAERRKACLPVSVSEQQHDNSPTGSTSPSSPPTVTVSTPMDVTPVHTETAYKVERKKSTPQSPLVKALSLIRGSSSPGSPTQSGTTPTASAATAVQIPKLDVLPSLSYVSFEDARYNSVDFSAEEESSK